MTKKRLDPVSLLIRLQGHTFPWLTSQIQEAAQRGDLKRSQRERLLDRVFQFDDLFDSFVATVESRPSKAIWLLAAKYFGSYPRSGEGALKSIAAFYSRRSHLLCLQQLLLELQEYFNSSWITDRQGAAEHHQVVADLQRIFGTPRPIIYVRRPPP